MRWKRQRQAVKGAFSHLSDINDKWLQGKLAVHPKIDLTICVEFNSQAQVWVGPISSSSKFETHKLRKCWLYNRRQICELQSVSYLVKHIKAAKNLKVVLHFGGISASSYLRKNKIWWTEICKIVLCRVVKIQFGARTGTGWQISCCSLAADWDCHMSW